MKPRLTAEQQRKRDLAQIHIAKAQLGLDDDTYRDILQRIGKVSSSRDLSTTDRLRVLQHLKTKGWKPKPRAAASKGAPRTVSKDKAPLLGKIGALLTDMQLPWSYANGIAKQMFRVERADWCDPLQLHKIVAALTYKSNKDKTDA